MNRGNLGNGSSMVLDGDWQGRLETKGRVEEMLSVFGCDLMDGDKEDVGMHEDMSFMFRVVFTFWEIAYLLMSLK